MRLPVIWEFGIIFYHFEGLWMFTRAVQIPHFEIRPLQIVHLLVFEIIQYFVPSSLTDVAYVASRSRCLCIQTHAYIAIANL